MEQLVLALRGAAAVGVLTTLAGGLPRTVQAGLAAAFGLWTALMLDVPLPPQQPLVLVALHELIVGATLGLIATLPLLAANIAGRLVDVGAGAAKGPYAPLFGVLAAAVFVGIDGHVAVLAAVVDSYRAVPTIVTVEPRVLGALGGLVPAGVALAVPWLVTAAVVEVAAGAGVRLAGRAGSHVGTASTAAVPAALVMITATLVSTLAVGIAALVRGAA
ncbi:MAG: flagellar biosynthetic protein FliR [Kofleriaceae bacterium]|nr:flagellar biosynthetic protein FliR [Kofleriaceae bacterium]